MRSLFAYSLFLSLFLCSLSPCFAAEDAAHVWSIAGGHEAEIKAVFDTEDVVPAPPFSVESIRIENGFIAIGVNSSDGRTARVTVRNGADSSEENCRSAAALRLCIAADSDRALVEEYRTWLLPRLPAAGLEHLWSKTPRPAQTAKKVGVTQSYWFLKIFFAAWLAAMAAIIALFFLSSGTEDVKGLRRVVLRTVAGLLLAALCALFIAALTGDWPGFR